MVPLPSLPTLSGDLALEVFTHESLRRDGLFVHSDFGDRERLSLLGENALRYAITKAHFRSKPALRAK
jgi:hypothetical protein